MTEVLKTETGYAPPLMITRGFDDPTVHEIVWWVPLAFVFAYWGGAWAWCQAVCWGRVRSCDVKWWGSVRADCY